MTFPQTPKEWFSHIKKVVAATGPKPKKPKPKKQLKLL